MRDLISTAMAIKPTFMRVTFLGLIVSVVALGWSVVPVSAQTFVEPTSPGGDTTAWPLNSSANPQYKRGSLIIGSAANQAKLCLNTDDYDDPTNCISSWSLLTGTYVRLQQVDLTNPAFQPLNPATYGTADTGFAHIKANGGQLFSLVAEANTSATTNNAVGIFANDAGSASNFAAYFEGNVLVQNGANSAKLCLNGVADLNSSTSTGCIDSWSDLASIVTTGTYVVLQPMASTPLPQAGQIGLSGAATVAQINQSAVVIGVPSSSVDPSYTCGDSICNGSETAISCAVDCDFTPPANVSNVTIDTYLVNASQPNVYGMVFYWSNPSDSDFAGVRIIRSTTVPTDPYKTDYPGMAVWDLPAGVSDLTQNTGLNRGTTYHYAIWSVDTGGNFASGTFFTDYVAPVSGDGSTGGCGNRFCIPT